MSKGAEEDDCVCCILIIGTAMPICKSFVAGNAYNASLKAAQLSAAAYSLGYAGYGPYGNAPGFLDGLSSNNPAAWFNLSQTLFNIDPPGQLETLLRQSQSTILHHE